MKNAAPVHPGVTPRLYLLVFTALLALTATTTAVAFVDLGTLNVVVMLGIAVVKALLVVLFFMHVRYSSRLTWLVVGSGAIWFGLLVLLTMADVLTRG